jgi:YVTN family beta-propeller protein
VVATATNTVVATVGVGSGPRGVAITPDAAFAYVVNLGGTVSVIETATNTVVATVGVGVLPAFVAITPDGAFAYVTNTCSALANPGECRLRTLLDSDTVSVIATATNTVVAKVGVGVQPVGVAITPDGGFAYVVNAVSSTVSVIETATNTVVATVGVGNLPELLIDVAITPDGGFAYVTNATANAVSVIATATNTVVATVGVEAGPSGVAITPTPPGDGNQPPSADAGGPHAADEGTSIGFDGSSSFDPDGDPLSYDWDFGDGSAHGSGATPVHVYADNGTYTITLSVDDGHGGSDVATTTATIGNVAPQVNAGTASSVQSGQTLSFRGDVTDAGAADTPSSWTLDWGDGTAPLSGNSAIPGSVSATHTYYGTGTFTLQLTVTDKDGGAGTGNRTVTVDPRSVAIAASPDAVSLSANRAKQIDIIIFSASGLDATQIDPATLGVGDGSDPDALPVQRKNGVYVLSMRDVNRDGLRDLTLSVEKLDAHLGLAAPSTTLVVRGAVPTSSGPIVLRGSVVMAVSP